MALSSARCSAAALWRGAAGQRRTSSNADDRLLVALRARLGQRGVVSQLGVLGRALDVGLRRRRARVSRAAPRRAAHQLLAQRRQLLLVTNLHLLGVLLDAELDRAQQLLVFGALLFDRTNAQRALDLTSPVSGGRPTTDDRRRPLSFRSRDEYAPCPVQTPSSGAQSHGSSAATRAQRRRTSAQHEAT